MNTLIFRCQNDQTVFELDAGETKGEHLDWDREHPHPSDQDYARHHSEQAEQASQNLANFVSAISEHCQICSGKICLEDIRIVC